ncbi:MAG: hypothetical protein ABUL77_03085 [Bacteroidota bacterium]
MTTPTLDRLLRAKSHITEWIHDLQVVGTHLGPSTRQELLDQLASASPVVRRDGSLELVLPALSSLGVGIFQRSFRVETMLVRVVPYGVA